MCGTFERPESRPDRSYRYPDSALGPGCKSAGATGAFVAATAPKGPSRSRACSDVVAKSTCSPSSSMRRANQRSRAEPPQLLAVGCRGRKCHGITNRDERFRPRRRTAAKREHVVHPHAVPACPPRLALPPTSYLHVPGAVPDCTIAQHEDREPGRAQPERNTEYCKDRPDHRYSLALASTPATEPPTRCRRYPDSAAGPITPAECG